MRERKKITEVFTPRRSEVNASMYVSRPEHEKKLKRAFHRNSHTLLYGESGNGKSWLYRKVLTDSDIPFVVANFAGASRKGSIEKEICDCLTEPGAVEKLGFSEEKVAEISAMVARAEIKHTGEFKIAQEDPLLKAFRLFASRYSGPKIVVLDNLEAIFSQDQLMTELADIVILLDDPKYAACDVRLLLVGVPNGVLEYFRETKNLESVANRVQEIPRVSGLNPDQTRQIVQRGFEQLKVAITGNTLIDLSEHVWNVTLGTAQRVHEYCEALAYEIHDNSWSYKSDLLDKADWSWMVEGLKQCYQVIEGHLNSRETELGRRNQVIYCVGRVSSHQFDSNVIDGLIRKEFPKAIPKTNMGIGSILGELSRGDAPLLSKNEKANTYSIRDPKYLMCIRIILYKESGAGKVIKRNFAR